MPIIHKSENVRTHNMGEEVVVNEAGAAQSKLTLRPGLLPPEALLRLSEVLGVGASKYATNNWRGIPFEDHIEHALLHIILLMNGDMSDDHLGHALTRMAFATATEKVHDFKAFTSLAQKPKDLAENVAEAIKLQGFTVQVDHEHINRLGTFFKDVPTKRPARKKSPAKKTIIKGRKRSK